MKNRTPSLLLALTTLALAAASSGASAARIVNLKAVQNDLPYDGFIVRYKDGTLARTNPAAASNEVNAVSQRLIRSRAIDTSSAANPKKPFSVGLVRKLGNQSHLFKPSRPMKRAEALAMLQELANNPEVDYVEPNLIFQHQLVPNDNLYAQQWGFGQNGIRAETAWELSTGAGVTVAVLDTGITAHPDLDANVVQGYDFVPEGRANDGDGRDGNPADPGDACFSSGRSTASWHGTHVAGTIAALTNNATGVAGTAHGAKIMPVRVLGTCGGETADIADGITWSSGGAVSGVTSLTPIRVANVINMSLGGMYQECPQTFQDAIAGAIARGTTVVAAAGNSNADTSAFAPATCAGVIAVAAVDVANNKASFSNYGPRVDVAAPGVDIWSTLNSGITSPAAPTYQSYRGTSMASPHVAGVVALVQSRRLASGLPPLAPNQMRTLIKSAVRQLPVGGCPEGCGAGIVDASLAVAIGSLPSIPVGSQVDASGKLQLMVFERTAGSPTSQFTNFAVEVPSDFVVIGGGVRGASSPQAHLLTASYPNSARSAWVVSTREVQQTAPTAITAWALALKVNGMTRAQLLSNMTYRSTTSIATSAPSASSQMPAGYVMLGGGFQMVNTSAANVTWASYPNSSTAWAVAAKEHGVSSSSAIRSHVIGLRTNLPVGYVTTSLVTVNSTVAHAVPSASVSVPAGYVLTGCGARLNWEGGYGNLLWHIEPKMASSVGSCDVKGTEHLYSSPATIGAHAIGIRLN